MKTNWTNKEVKHSFLFELLTCAATGVVHLHNCSICCSNVGGRVKPLSASCCSDIHLSIPELQLLTRLLSSSRSKTGLKGDRKAWDGTLASAMRLAITTCDSHPIGSMKSALLRQVHIQQQDVRQTRLHRPRCCKAPTTSRPQ